MTLYSQEHRDYGANRKYPFTDASTLYDVPRGLLADAVVYVASDNPDDTVVWLETLDLGAGTAHLRTGGGVTIAGRVAGTEAHLTDTRDGQAAGMLLFDPGALAAAHRTRFALPPKAALLCPSCVFISAARGVASLNGRAGHISLVGEDGVSVYTGTEGGRNIIRVDAIGTPKSYDGCPESSGGPAIRCIRWIQESGSLISVDSTDNGAVVLNGVSTFTGEALCADRDVAAGDTAWYLNPWFSPEVWLENQTVKDEMEEMGWWWAIADKHDYESGTLKAYPMTGSVYAGLSGLDLGVLVANPDYGYPATTSVRPLYVRDFLVQDQASGEKYNPVYGGAANVPVLPSMRKVDDKYLVSTPGYGGSGERVYIDVPDDDAYILPFAALVPVRTAAPPWEPAQEQDLTVCAK